LREVSSSNLLFGGTESEMQITDQMIQQAVKRATELGILPRKDVADDIATNNEIMEEILQAAINAEPPDEAGSLVGEARNR
jgi:hypothetical protein